LVVAVVAVRFACDHLQHLLAAWVLGCCNTLQAGDLNPSNLALADVDTAAASCQQATDHAGKQFAHASAAILPSTCVCCCVPCWHTTIQLCCVTPPDAALHIMPWQNTALPFNGAEHHALLRLSTSARKTERQYMASVNIHPRSHEPQVATPNLRQPGAWLA
jgi:hypothetical protein